MTTTDMEDDEKYWMEFEVKSMKSLLLYPPRFPTSITGNTAIRHRKGQGNDKAEELLNSQNNGRLPDP